MASKDKNKNNTVQDPKLMTRGGKDRTKNVSSASGSATPKTKQPGTK